LLNGLLIDDRRSWLLIGHHSWSREADSDRDITVMVMVRGLMVHVVMRIMVGNVVNRVVVVACV